MADVIARNPNEVFLIEGHTDATGNDVDNLSLSDRRAGSVAEILTETYQIPPENLVTQGYGSQYLKMPTQAAERANRRVTSGASPHSSRAGWRSDTKRSPPHADNGRAERPAIFVARRI